MGCMNHLPPFGIQAKTYITDKKLSTYCVIMVRLAPSAKDAQPWHVHKAGNIYHFYANYKQGLFKEEKVIKRVDIGIALSHFHQTALERGLTGTFETISQEDVAMSEKTYYIIAWCADETNK